MRQLQTRVLLLTSLVVVGALVVVVSYQLPPKTTPPVEVAKTDLERRLEDMAREKSLPLSQLPANIKPPKGQVSIHFDDSRGHLQAIVVNRTGKVMSISEAGLQRLLMVEAEFAPGDRQRISRYYGSFCGNSYCGSPYLLNDHFCCEPIRMNSKRSSGESMEYRIRLRSYTTNYGEMAPSAPVMSSVIVALANDAQFDPIGMGERTTKELWQIARNEPTLGSKQFSFNLRVDAIRRLQTNKVDADELIRVVEAIDPEKQEHQVLKKAGLLDRLRSSKAKPVK